MMDILNYLLCFYFICLCKSVGVARNCGTRTCTWCMSIRVLRLRSLKADAAVHLMGISQEKSGGKIEQMVKCSCEGLACWNCLALGWKGLYTPISFCPQSRLPQEGHNLGMGARILKEPAAAGCLLTALPTAGQQALLEGRSQDRCWLRPCR